MIIIKIQFLDLAVFVENGFLKTKILSKPTDNTSI